MLSEVSCHVDDELRRRRIGRAAKPGLKHRVHVREQKIQAPEQPPGGRLLQEMEGLARAQRQLRGALAYGGEGGRQGGKVGAMREDRLVAERQTDDQLRIAACGPERGVELRGVAGIPHPDDERAEFESRGDLRDRLGAVDRIVGDQPVESRSQRLEIGTDARRIGGLNAPVEDLEGARLVGNEAAMRHLARQALERCSAGGAALADRLRGGERANEREQRQHHGKISDAALHWPSIAQPKGECPMNDEQSAKAARFRALHERPGAFVIPNVWDGGSAAIMAGLGFEALATSSSAAAATLGKLDGGLTRDEALSHARAVVAASALPVSGDLEQGFGDSPETVAETIRRAAAIGLVGGSIEDASGNERAPIFELPLAVERVAAAVGAARKLPFPFIVTARAENYLHGRADLDDTVRRLQAFERVGADVLFAPGLSDLAAVRTVCQSLSKPVNFMVGIRGRSFSVAELADAGVKRISLSTSLYRAAVTGLYAAGREVKESGTFGYLETIMSGKDLAGFLKPQR